MAQDTYEEAFKGLVEIIVDETGVPANSIRPEQSFADDLDVDSLSMMTIVTLAEEKFKVRIPDEDIRGLTTVQEAIDYILKVES